MSPRIFTPSSGGGPGYDGQQAGMYSPSFGPWANMGATIPVANRASGHRIVPPRNMLITRIAFGVTNPATADDQVDVGIMGSPTLVILGSSGPKNGYLNGAAGPKTVTLQAPVQLIAGQVYYGLFAIGTIGGTGATVVASNSSPQIQTLQATGLGGFEQGFNNAGFPLSSLSAFGPGLTLAPMLALLE